VNLVRYGVVVIVALVGIPTVLGLFDRWTPYLELATLFRLHYAAVLVVAALVALILRQFPVALAASFLVVVNLVVISRMPSAPASAKADSPRLRVLIANVEYGNREYGRLARLVVETDPDLVAIIELTPAWVRGLQPALSRHRHRRLAPEEGAYGVGLYSRLPFAGSSIERLPADGSASVIATVALGARPMGIVVTHLHTAFAGARRSRQLRALGDELSKLGELAVVCGDFNSVPWSQPIRDLANDADLRSIYGRFGLAGTWPATAGVLRIPLDNCLVSKGVAVAGGRVGPDIGSDHLPLIVDLAPTRGLMKASPNRRIQDRHIASQ
jgi:endonuclease/exonuclease/phosphatase (EEP) superfamily protein YafD